MFGKSETLDHVQAIQVFQDDDLRLSKCSEGLITAAEVFEILSSCSKQMSPSYDAVLCARFGSCNCWPAFTFSGSIMRKFQVLLHGVW